VDLVRRITTGSWGWVQVADVAFLLVMLAAGLVVAGRRMGRLLCR
jgi:lipooligosaccharide transport system permease protein